MKSRLVGAAAVAVTSLGIFAGTAGASPGTGFYESGHSTNSIYNSGGLGTCRAASVAAGNNANSAPVRFYPNTTYYNCGGEV